MRSNDSTLPSGLTRSLSGVPDHVYQHSRELVRRYLRLPWMDAAPFVARRCTFQLLPQERGRDHDRWMEKGWEREPYHGWSYTFDVEPLGGTKHVEVTDYGRKKFFKRYRIPLGAHMIDPMIEPLEGDPSLAYRGMSWEEWAVVCQTGWIRSKGWWNFEPERGLTLFGKLDSARAYASRYSPWYFKPGQQVPGMIAGIDRRLTVGAGEHPGLPRGTDYRAVVGRVSANEIQEVWMLWPYEIRYEAITLTDKGKYVQDEGRAPEPRVGAIQLDPSSALRSAREADE